MVKLHFAISAILATAVAAGCLSYMIAPLARVEPVVGLPPAVLSPPAPTRRSSARIEAPAPPSAHDLAAATYEKAAEAILRRAADSHASIDRVERPIAGPIPFPKEDPRKGLDSR